MIIKNRYSFFIKIKLVCFLLFTKLFIPKARLIRLPIDIRGKQMIDFGRHLTTGVNCRLEAFEVDGNNQVKIHFGDRVQLNDYVHINGMKKIMIGDDTLIASHVYISDNSHGIYSGSIQSSPQVSPINRDYKISEVLIGNKVWIGEGVIIMPGVTIGDGSIIGAHSIVNVDVPENSIAVGAPIRIVKKYNGNEWERL